MRSSKEEAGSEAETDGGITRHYVTRDGNRRLVATGFTGTGIESPEGAADTLPTAEDGD
ncbi:hypothetical protein AGMMS49991_11800 [Spirochaetia bacterium]|nr:hypothetical protein AGMMS49991_11800 [Spirochaetia bacterium]